MKIFQDMKDTGASGQVTNVVSQLRFLGEDVFDHVSPAKIESMGTTINKCSSLIESA